MSTPTGRRPRVLFLGMQSDFSTPVLQALLANDCDVCAVVVPVASLPALKQSPIQRREQPNGRRVVLPLHSVTPSIIDIAWAHKLPVWEVRKLTDAITYSTLAAYEADIVCVACFPQRIPRAILDMPRLGCLNVHPSLLPLHRGPVPLFWTFRNNEQVTGVTIHFMEETLDTGDILLQEPVEVPEGIGYTQLEQQCAAKGGALLARVVQNLYTGNRTRTLQDERKSTTQSFPIAEDFVIHANEWSARHVYTFIKGVGAWDMPIEIRVDGDTLFTNNCISYSLFDKDKVSEAPSVGGNEWSRVVCRDGWVKVRVVEK